MYSFLSEPARMWARLTGKAGSQRTVRWSQGSYKEFRFWRDYLSSRGGGWSQDFADRIDPNLPLQHDLDALIPAHAGPTVRILDVGAGPLTYVGKTSPRFAVDLVAVDPLAETYDKLLRKYQITPPVRTRKADAEHLLDLFPADSFDLVSARNCIDHAYDPFGAIEQMVAVTKPGCAVFMHHHLNEAARQNFVGLHQWNFADEAGHFILSSRSERIDVSLALSDRATVANVIFDDAWIVTRIHKM